MFYRVVFAVIISNFLFIRQAHTENESQMQNKSYRTFMTIQRYNMESNGTPNKPVSNVKLEILFPTGKKVTLPEGGEFWPIGNGQTQEINRTFEIPVEYIQNHNLSLKVQMIRQGVKINPCEINAQSLPQFNRGYICHTNTDLQAQHNIPQDKIAKEGIELRVFTDLNSAPKDIPQNAIALK